MKRNRAQAGMTPADVYVARRTYDDPKEASANHAPAEASPAAAKAEAKRERRRERNRRHQA